MVLVLALVQNWHRKHTYTLDSCQLLIQLLISHCCTANNVLTWLKCKACASSPAWHGACTQEACHSFPPTTVRVFRVPAWNLCARSAMYAAFCLERPHASS